MQPIESDVIVVGGGLAGLASAVALSDAGLRVTVLEAQKALGGRARSWRHAPSGDVVDTAAQVVHSEQRNLLRLVERLGTGSRIAWLPGLATLATAPRPTTLQHRRWPLPLSLVPDLARMPGLSWLDLLSSLRAVCRSLRYTERDAGDLDAVSGREWLQRCGVAPAAVDLLWRPLAASALYAPLEQCSAAALARVHAMLLGERQLHFGVPRVGLSDLYVAPAVAAIEHAGGRVLSGAPVMRLRAFRGRSSRDAQGRDRTGGPPRRARRAAVRTRSAGAGPGGPRLLSAERRNADPAVVRPAADEGAAVVRAVGREPAQLLLPGPEQRALCAERPRRG